MPAKVKEHATYVDATAQWFITPNDVSQPHQDFEREEILKQVSQFTQFGVHGNVVVMKVPNGRVMMTRDGDIIWFDAVPRGRWERLRFWMNRPSVRHIGEALRAASEKRRPFDVIFFRW